MTRRLMIIPAAGRGSRLGSALPKLLVPVRGRAMIDYVLDRHAPLMEAFIVVVAPGFLDLVGGHIRTRSERVDLVVQPEPTGMLDAILVPKASIERAAPTEVWVSWCDQVAIRRETTERLAGAMADPAPALAFPTAFSREPYIHFERNQAGRIVDVRQRREGAVMPEEGEADVGLFALGLATYRELLPQFALESGAATGTGERNFLPFIPWLAARGEVVETVAATDPTEALGINTPSDLLAAEALFDGICGR